MSQDCQSSDMLFHRDLLSPFGESASLYVQRTSHKATLPVRSTPGAAGYDLACAEEIINFSPRERILVSTDLKMEIPVGFYGRIAPRSGLALKYGIDVGAGVIDWDYRGVIKILLFNHGSEKLNFPVGTKIAQIIIEKIVTPNVVEEKVLGETLRGDGGFGSTDHREVEDRREVSVDRREEVCVDRREEVYLHRTELSPAHSSEVFVDTPRQKSKLPPLLR